MSFAIPPAVQESLRILATHRALFEGRHRSGWGITMGEPEIARVVSIFESNRARWALIGAHAVGLLTEPRATVDFDFIVEDGKLRGVMRDLTTAFGDLGAQDQGAAVRLSAIDVDLVRSTNHPLFRVALDQVQTIGAWKVPRPEVIIALKFLAAVNPWRNVDKRAQDMVDLRRVYHAVGTEALDRGYLESLAAMVYPGAEREFTGLLERIERGDPISI